MCYIYVGKVGVPYKLMRKKTLRKMTPVAREVGVLANEATSLARRLRNLAHRLNRDHKTEVEMLRKTMAEWEERYADLPVIKSE